MNIMLDGIVGIEFHIKKLEAKSKLSQNDEKNRLYCCDEQDGRDAVFWYE